ncbi:deoxyuridine 5'-triphosphate nucleotidohydrolase [Gregarina niphandrodes]|uniref:Deoxyuridine 5'-triphosphate nucleotidohydrolase n=1 Tax=Gregarina niphandrodes TaxID=110365 RepID=A0A023B8T6_GRENI|nr:deoxyuridine 5'-triphosphate nucleotidohydrolase [Gregarina niphandrodes]EZG70486.1 deoxyuridine 5'-triphosphate nucleotidohydrolase [Gregarina niphandrodes]|eukprot:XP_011129937.1 deoxyuridine 5'-triphosphate nucleotidohydrolase [Gregarina niphandrodes]
MFLKIQGLNDGVKELYKNHPKPLPGDAGFDLYSPESITIKAGETKAVDLQIKASAHKDSQTAESIPYFIMPRSSISKTPLRLANSVGLIDAGYRGNLMALLDNIKDTDYTIEKGQRLLQAVAFDGSQISFELVEQLSTTVRGEGGIGSTGR